MSKLLKDKIYSSSWYQLSKERNDCLIFTCEKISLNENPKNKKFFRSSSLEFNSLNDILKPYKLARIFHNLYKKVKNY